MKFALLLLVLAASPAAVAGPRETVQHAFETVLAAGGFRGRAEGNVFGPGLPALSGDVDVEFPDRIHVRTDEMEFIARPDGAWISAFGLWTPTDRSLLPVTAFDRSAMREAIASIHDVRSEGTAATRQCAAHVYRFRSTGRLPGAGASGDVRAWICDSNGKPARIEATDTQRDRLVFDFDWSRRPHVAAPDE